MKKIFLFLCIGASLFAADNASVWEGTAKISDELPETGLFIATNSFPLNTMVDVKNLENEISKPMLVYSRLESSGFLALLSMDATNALGIPDDSIGRISMSQSADQQYDLSLVPAKARPPGKGPMPDERDFVTGINPPVKTTAPVYIDPSLIRKPIEEPPKTSFSGFSVPLITSLEKGKHYIQVAAYSKTESAEYELSRLDNTLPRAVMGAVVDGKQVYRVLIGPVNIGESGAILQRYKPIYKDAFLRLGT
jgi:hypothetical protein